MNFDEKAKKDDELIGIKFKANFLWPYEEDSIEEAGYEFANCITEEYRKILWDILIKRIGEDNNGNK